MILRMDIIATACEALGGHPPRCIDGIRFWQALLCQPEPKPARDLCFVRRESGNAYGGKTIDTFRRGDWKLLQDSLFAPLELFDLKSDPRETTDVARQERQIFNQLSAGLRKPIQRGGQTPWQQPSKVP
jgi:arylsulfatase A-like enzyme